MIESLPFKLTATIVVICAAALSIAFYDHKGASYRTNRRQARGTTHFKLVYKFLQLSSIGVSLCAFWFDHRWLLELYPIGAQNWMGLGAICLASWMFIAARTALGANYSPCFDPHEPFKIVSTGVYAYVRHPIYTANIALLAAVFIATGSAWLLFNTLVLSGYYFHAAQREEKQLADSHSGYRSYCERTGRFLPRWPGSLA